MPTAVRASEQSNSSAVEPARTATPESEPPSKQQRKACSVAPGPMKTAAVLEAIAPKAERPTIASDEVAT